MQTAMVGPEGRFRDLRELISATLASMAWEPLAAWSFGEELRAGVDGDNGREAELGESDRLESGPATEVQGRSARDGRMQRSQHTLKKRFLLGDFLFEGNAEHPHVMFGEQLPVMVGNGGHGVILRAVERTEALLYSARKLVYLQFKNHQFFRNSPC